MNEYIQYITSEQGMKFLAFIGGGLVVLGVGIFQLLKFFKKDISASNNSIASGRDTKITYKSDENNKSK